MNEIVIGIIVLLIMVMVILSGRKKQIADAKSEKEAGQAEEESWKSEQVLSYGQVQDAREELVHALEENLADQPEQLERIKKIINDWAELKVRTFQERRSWVRKPDQDE
tara:strand:+ start:373 stop:699 length:327 start_codon:yes stop_codon:yes gene_type:complete